LSSFRTDDLSYPDPPKAYPRILAIAFAIRKYVLRYLTLPRPYFLRVHNMSTHPSPNGTYFSLKYEAAPYYIQPTIWQRWSPNAWYLWIMGLPIPGDEGSKYHPEGYKITDMGPRGMKGKGGEYMAEAVQGFETSRTGGCPFAR
jgi:hypothetical protein